MASTNLSHPVFTFEVNLELNRTEKFGPLTNETDNTPHHPDYFTPDLDAQKDIMHPDRKNHRTGLLGVNGTTASINGMNFKHGDTFTLYGLEAIETRKKYVAGTWNNNVPTAGLGSILEIVE